MSAKSRFWIERQMKERQCDVLSLFIECYSLRYGAPDTRAMGDCGKDARAHIQDAYIPPYVAWCANEGDDNAVS